MIISVVIPSYNGRSLLEKNLPAVLKACTTWNNSDWEIIIVDDASTDTTVSWLKQTYPRIKVIQNFTNLRFARSVNKGVAAAQGEIVILLNNDVKPQPDFILPLIKHFQDKAVFAVGCLEKNGGILGGRGEGKFSRGFIIHWRPRNQDSKDTLWVTAGSAAFRKSIWDQLGGFDPLFRPAYDEDRDLSYNALKSGFIIASYYSIFFI